MAIVFMSLVIVHHTSRSEFMKIEVVRHILLAPTKKNSLENSWSTISDLQKDKNKKGSKG